MEINKESNAYTFGFAIILVVVVGSILASLSLGLKDKQEENGVVKKKMDILKAMLSSEEADKINRSNAEENFIHYVDLENAIVLDVNGKEIEGIFDANGEIDASKGAFDIDIRQENKDKKRMESHKNYPLFMAEKDGKKLYIIPIVGKGLWGPIWGNICIGEDKRTIVGASFGHQGETPGLGAEITQQFFVNRWIGETILDENGNFTAFEVVKDGSGQKPQKVDGITGGTITSKGVEEMSNRCLSVYASYFKSNMQ
jgi:Na+-transporting NADH:ubiquinone oxidoreductase subunit C